jgi:hypothetical protein
MTLSFTTPCRFNRRNRRKSPCLGQKLSE